MATEHATREEWLTAAARTLCAWLEGTGHPVRASYRVACGFPCKGASSSKRQTIGEAHPVEASAGKVAEVFVSPVIAEPTRVLATLAHELVHVATPGAKHGKVFKRVATALGLEGKMTATHAGKALDARLNALALELGTYPHDALTLAKRGSKGSRLLLITCGCGIKSRASAQAAEEMIVAGWTCRTCGKGIGMRDSDDESGEPGEGEGE